MSWAAIHNAIRSRVEANRGTTLVVYDNQPTEVPESTIWARAVIVNGPTEQVTAGQPLRYRREGTLVLQFHDANGRGDGGILARIDAIVPAFRSVSAAGIRYKTPRVERIGTSGVYYRVDLLCPWDSDLDT